MVQLKRAHQELFRRTPDECFASLAELHEHCHREHEESCDRWQPPQHFRPHVVADRVQIALETEPDCELNDWSFAQLCRLASVSKSTLNVLTPDTASRVLQETLPRSDRPIQALLTGPTVRSLHGASYTRLWNDEVLEVVSEFDADFSPPQPSITGGTGLYCGEQDMFAFLIDPTGWIEIDDEAFAPGFFVWNSEVGRRSLGIQTFWMQAVCANHIVWDALDVSEFKRKHTANVHDGLDEIRRRIAQLIERRDERRDRFAEVLRRAARMQLGDDADEVLKQLGSHGIPQNLGKQALEIARERGGFSIFALVDALTRLTQTLKYAGERVEVDAKVGTLLGLALAA